MTLKMPSSLGKSATGFLCRLAVIYIVLLLPWPGLNETYRQYFNALGHVVFPSDQQRELSFETAPDQAHTTRIVIVNRDLMQADGSGPVRNLDIDTRGFWRMTALLIAFTLATPISWARRLWALLWGMLALHGVILLLLAFFIWNESTYVSLMTMTPWGKTIADRIQQAAIAQTNLAIPVLIWTVTLFLQSLLRTEVQRNVTRRKREPRQRS